MNFRVLRLGAPAMLGAAGLLLPFVNKAYSVDDPFFLLQAEQVGRDFFHPLNYTLCWFSSLSCGPVYAQAPGSALMGYALLPVLPFASAEWVVHVLQLVALMAGIVATVSIALRLGASEFEARCAGMLMVVFPPMLAMTNTAMPDVLSMTLGAIGIERFLAWLDGRGVAPAVCSALALGVAPFGRMHALALIAVAGWIAWQRGRLVRAAPILTGALAVFACLTLATREPGAAAGLPPASNISVRNVGQNARALLFGYVINFPVTLFWLIRRRRYLGWLSLAVAATFGVLFFGLRLYGQDAAVWAVGGLSVLCLTDLFLCLWRARSCVPLHVWMLAPCVVLPYIHLPPKILMISAPAAAFVSIGLLRDESPALRRAAATALIAGCAIVSLLVLHTDRQFAKMSKDAAATLVAPAVTKGERVWFAGRWGIYWYAQKAGAKVVLPNADEPAPGDLLLTEQYEARDPILDRFPRRHLVATRVFAWTGGRVMSHRDRAGLYSNGWGPLPWSYGSGEVDRFELWRIQ
jgi:hypothetical protein